LQQNIDQLIGDHPCYINFPTPCCWTDWPSASPVTRW
jgi:hypothetical protein